MYVCVCVCLVGLKWYFYNCNWYNNIDNEWKETLSVFGQDAWIDSQSPG